jgi:2-polyprenyl-3-methyl-5-hydroxy-6-metoxy-1,4-benzoquinol methylase
VNPAVSSPCPICAAPLRHLSRCGERFSYYQCETCSHVTTQPIPTPAELSAFYDGFLFARPSDQERTAHQRAIERDVERIAHDLRTIGNLDRPLRVLDWGGGVGYYANGFAKLGHRCTMIDIDPQACDYARQTFGDALTVINGDPIAHRFTEKYDVVFCNQVIEHCTDVVALVEAIRRVLLPNGIAIITTPNQQCKEFYFRHGWLLYYLRRTVRSTWELPVAFLRFVRSPWICCDPPRHLHAFNRRSLGQLVSRCGLEPLECFGEYSDTQYYSPATPYLDWKFRRLRSLARLAYQSVNFAGIRLLHLLSPSGRWGNNLVIYARSSTT